jgi:ATP-binding protein involved in chromosome partitioning
MRIFSEFAADADLTDSHRREALRARIRANFADVAATLIFASAKGGAGKSVIAVNVAAALALKGRKVALIDADLNFPSVSAMLGMKQPRGLPMVGGIQPAPGPHGLRIISSDLLAGGEAPPIAFVESDGQDSSPLAPSLPAELRPSEAFFQMLAQSRLGAIDFAIIDVAPGIEDLHALARMLTADGIVLVSHTSGHAVRATQQAVRILRRCEAPVLAIVENMAGFNCDGCRSVRPLMPEGTLAGVATDLELPVIGRLPFDPRLAESADRGQLFVHQFAETPLAKIFCDIALSIERLVAEHH